MSSTLEQTREIEKMLKTDARNMKSAGRGVFHRASRKGFIRGGMKTPYDFMTTKEKKALNGEVKIYKMHTQDIKNVKSLSEIESMEPEKRLQYFTEVIEAYTKRALCEHWRTSSSTLYNKIMPAMGYDINKNTDPKTTSKRGRKKKTAETQTSPTTNMNSTESNSEVVSIPSSDALPKKEVPVTNYTPSIFAQQEFNVKGKYDAQHLDLIYRKLQLLLDQGTLYDIEINIKELQS